MPQPKDVRISPLLTQTSLGYKQDGYIAEQLFPIIPVVKDSAKIASYGMDNLRIEKALRGIGAPAAEVGHSVSIGDHYNLEEFALKEEIADELRENCENPINADIDAVVNLTDKLLVAKEKAVADVVRDPAIITQTSAPVNWSDFVNSDPFADVKLAKTTIFTATGKEANTITICWDVLQELLIHPLLLARFPGAAEVTPQMLNDSIARLFGLERMLVGKAMYNSAKEGQADVLAKIWTADVIVSYTEPNPSLKSRSLGFTYQKAGQNRQVLKWRDADPTTRKDWVSVSDKYDQKLVSASCAYLLDALI